MNDLMKKTNKVIVDVVEGYQESKAKQERWLAANEDLRGSTAFQMALVNVILMDMGISFWSSFLAGQDAGELNGK